jgi:hypothetical protein
VYAACAHRASGTSSAQQTRNSYRQFLPVLEANRNLRCVSCQGEIVSFCQPEIFDSSEHVSSRQVGRDGKGSQPDSLVLCAGRTMGLGPGPNYVNIWYSAGCGLERLDAWDEFSRACQCLPKDLHLRLHNDFDNLTHLMRANSSRVYDYVGALRQFRLHRYSWKSFKVSLSDRLCTLGLL